MLVRNTFLALIPKPHYRTSVQRHIRCCSVLLTNQRKNESSFQLPEKWKTRKIALENEFKNRFPRTAEAVFRVRDGITDLFLDGKDMMILQSKLVQGTREMHDLSLRELELIHETKVHLQRMVPILFIFVIPVFGNFIVAFLAYAKPLRFLSPHFWTNKQKVANAQEEHANRVSVFLPIMNYLETHSAQNTKLSHKFRNLLESVKSGRTPSLTELASCEELFGTDQTFSLERLSSSHLDNLLILHNQRRFSFKTYHLREWSLYMKLVDRRINQNGGGSILSSEQLRKYCFQRGVNANAMTEEEMRDYLNQWIAFSEQIPNDRSTLLLQAPAIIGFSHKSNLTVTDDSSL